MQNLVQKNAMVWEEIYASGHQMQYPDDGFVRLFAQIVKPNILKNSRILDYGFGSGATIQHMLRMGYNVDGVELSQTAIDLTQQRLKEVGLSAELHCHEGASIGFDDQVFDAVVAWQSLSYNNLSSLRDRLLDMHRVLKPNGVFLASLSMPGSSLEKSSTPLNDGFGSRVINSGSQKGAYVCIPDRMELQNILVGFNAHIGSLTYDLGEFGLEPNSFWIVTFTKH